MINRPARLRRPLTQSIVSTDSDAKKQVLYFLEEKTSQTLGGAARSES